MVIEGGVCFYQNSMQQIETKDWTFYPSTQELAFTDGQRIELPNRLSNCLLKLIEAEGDTVDYDELLSSVWKTQHREASTISSVVSELRKIIKCSKTGTTYIKTVPKKGYRFVGDYKVVTQAGSVPMSPNTVAENTNDTLPVPPTIPSMNAQDVLANTKVATPQSKRGRRPLAMLVGGLCVALATAMFYFFVTGQTQVSATKARASVSARGEYIFDHLEILTHEPGVITEFDVSPTMNWVVFSHQQNENDTKLIRAKHLSSGQESVLTGKKGERLYAPKFSHSGRRVAYIRSTSTACYVEVVDFSESGFVQDASSTIADCGFPGLWTTPTFSLDDSFLYFSRSTSLSDPMKIIRQDLTGASSTTITAPPLIGRGDYAFSISPDGNKLAIIRNENWSHSAIVVLNLSSLESKKLLTNKDVLYSIAWLDDTSLLYRGQSEGLSSIDINTGTTQVVSGKGMLNLHYPVVRKGRVFAFQGQLFDSEIYAVEKDGMLLTQQITSPFLDNKPLSIQPVTYFLSNRSGERHVWKKQGSMVSKVTSTPIPASIVNILFNPVTDKLFLIEANTITQLALGSDETTLVFSSEQAISNVSLSDTHDSLVFTRNVNDRWVIEEFQLSSGKVVRLTSGFMGKKYGGKLYFKKFSDDALYEYDLASNHTSTLLAHFDPMDVDWWTLSQNHLVYIEDQQHVVFVDLATSVTSRSETMGDIRNLICQKDTLYCLFDVYHFGNTNIVELTKHKPQ